MNSATRADLKPIKLRTGTNQQNMLRIPSFLGVQGELEMLIRILASAILVGCPLTAQAATFTEYGDRSAFEAATSSLTTETFNSYVSDVPIATSTLDVGDFTIDGTSTTFLSIDADNSNGQSIDGSTYLLGVGFDGQSFDYVFDSSITAFAFDSYGINNANLDGKQLERIKILIGTETFSMPLTDGPELGFFGVTSDMAFDKVTVQAQFLSPDANGEVAGFDNVSYGEASVIPLPATILLLLSAVGGVGLARRGKVPPSGTC